MASRKGGRTPDKLQSDKKSVSKKIKQQRSEIQTAKSQLKSSKLLRKRLETELKTSVKQNVALIRQCRRLFVERRELREEVDSLTTDMDEAWLDGDTTKEEVEEQKKKNSIITKELSRIFKEISNNGKVQPEASSGLCAIFACESGKPLAKLTSCSCSICTDCLTHVSQSGGLCPFCRQAIKF